MSMVVIGVDPHKASHTVVAVGERELPLGDLRVQASAAQAGRLLSWARQWPQRVWAIENTAGLGYLLAQQLAGAGERVFDVQPKLAARDRRGHDQEDGAARAQTPTHQHDLPRHDQRCPGRVSTARQT